MPSDKQAQEEQARRLRERIQAMIHPQTASPTQEGAPPAPPKKSLREAIQDRMRDLDAESHG
jgi:hypothetical protein